MRRIVFTFILIGCLYTLCSGQRLTGQYIYEQKGRVFYAYVFAAESNTFSTTQSGDMGIFYGEGTYKIQDGKLILKFDSTGVSKKINNVFKDFREQRNVYVMTAETIALTIKNIGKRKFDMECDYTGRVETFKRGKSGLRKSEE